MATRNSLSHSLNINLRDYFAHFIVCQAKKSNSTPLLSKLYDISFIFIAQSVSNCVRSNVMKQSIVDISKLCNWEMYSNGHRQAVPKSHISSMSRACSHSHSVYFLLLLSAFNVRRDQSVQRAIGERDVSRIHSLSALHPWLYIIHVSLTVFFFTALSSLNFVKSGKAL